MSLMFQAKITRDGSAIMIRIPREMFDVVEIEGGDDIYAVHDERADEICLMSRSKRYEQIKTIEQNRTAEDPPGKKEDA